MLDADERDRARALRAYLQETYEDGKAAYSNALEALALFEAEPEQPGGHAGTMLEAVITTRECKGYLEALDNGATIDVVRRCGIIVRMCSNDTATRLAGDVLLKIFGNL